MLDAMRKRANSWVVRALLLVLIASFAVWGIGDVFVGRQDIDVAATVGDQEVPLNEVDRAFETDRRALQEQLGVTLDRQQAASFGLLNRSLQTLIVRAMVDQHVKDLGLGVADAEVAEAIRDDPAFQSAGSFDRVRFDTFLRASGLSEAQFVDTMRREIGRDRILDTFRGLITVPDALAERIGRYRGETRSGTVLVVPRDAMVVGQPDEAALRALLEAEPDRFTAPEYRDLTIVTLTPDTILDEIEISEATLREEYALRQDFYTQPERRRVGQLLASDEAVIEAARTALDQGAVFADLADTMAADGLTYATIGPTTEAELPPELAEPIFALAENEVSEPVESLFGWHLFRLIEIEPEVVRSFDEVQGEIRDDLARDLAIDQLPELAAALDDGIAAGETLEDAAAAIGVAPLHFAAIDAEGRDTAGELLPDAPASDILAGIFTAPVGETSLLEETSAGSFYMYRVDGVEAPRPRELAEVEDELTELWRLEEQDRLAAEAVEALMAEARAGRTLEAIAGEQGEPVTVRSFEPLTRAADGSAAGLTPEAVAALFTASEGELVREPVPTRQGMAILRVDDVTVPVNPVTPELMAQLEAGLRNDILAQYEAALRDRYPVEINDAALATLFPSDTF